MSPDRHRGLRRWGWPAVLTLLATVANGYEFGTSDQEIHLTFLRRALEPGSMPGDLVAEGAAAHSSWFWALQAPVIGALGWESLPAVYLVAFLVALFATFAVLVRLAEQLHEDARAAWLAPALLLVFKACPAHVHTFEPELINRTVTHPVLLAAVWLLLAGRPVRAALLAGLAFNLHASTAAHAALVLGLGALFDPQLRRRTPLMALGFLAGAAPLLARVHLLGTGADPLDAEWLHVLQWRMPHHLLPWRWPPVVWAVGAAQVALLAWAVRSVEQPQRRRCLGMAAGVGACCILGTVAVPLGQARLLGLHWWEAWIFLAVLAWVLAAGALLRLPRPAALALAGLLALDPGGLAMGRATSPGFTPSRPERAELARLVRGEAADCPDCPVVVAPDGPGWLRAEAGVPLYVTVKDGGEAAFSRTFALQWRSRLGLLCGRDVLAGPPPVDEWRGYRAVGAAAREAFGPAGLVATKRQGARLVVLPAGQAVDGARRVGEASGFEVWRLW